jgi:hypothetical protein
VSTYPGNYAVPGSFQPGTAWPGTPLASAAMFTYLGSQVLTFPQYLDAGAGRTLTASPGGTYLIQVADAIPNLGPFPPGVPPSDVPWAGVAV